MLRRSAVVMSNEFPTVPPQLVGAAIWRVAFETLLKFKLGERGEGRSVAFSEGACPCGRCGDAIDHDCPRSVEGV